MYVVCSTVDDHPTPSTKRFMQGRAGTANGSGETCGFSGGTCGASVGPLRQAAPQRHLRRLQKKKGTSTTPHTINIKHTRFSNRCK